MATSEYLSSHYTSVSNTYEAAFFYSSESYIEFLVSNVLSIFSSVNGSTRVVDLGGGTGNFTQTLAEAMQVQEKILCVDAYAEMLTLAKQHSLVDTLLMDAVQFSQVTEVSFR